MTDKQPAMRPAAVADTWIVAVLLRELDKDPVVGREHIDVACDGGVLSLVGQVSAQLARRRAVEIAQVVHGVRAIVDRIDVVAPARKDGELEFLAAGALSKDRATAGEPIAARARGGVVHLTGTVDSNATRWIAERDLLAIPGVADVTDDLVVSGGTRSDARLVRQLRREMRDDPWIDDGHITISVDKQAVRLVGYVHSAAERARAERDARACSPNAVDVTDLRIDSLSDGTLRGDPEPPRSDDELTRAFLAALSRDPRVRPFVPGVQVRDRVAVVTGEAPSRDAAQAVRDDARDVPGMADTHVDLRVADAAPGGPADADAAVLYQARSSLQRDTRLEGMHLAVDVFHGRITVRGTVPSEVDRRRAIGIASNVPGAQGVDDELTVEKPTLARP